MLIEYQFKIDALNLCSYDVSRSREKIHFQQDHRMGMSSQLVA
jgi:hypothetical protein